jgi:hypothetical protein
VKTNEDPAHPGMPFSGNRLTDRQEQDETKRRSQLSLRVLENPKAGFSQGPIPSSNPSQSTADEHMNQERLRMLQNTPIFGGLSDQNLGLLLSEAPGIELGEGQFLFQENDPGDSMYVLESGRVAVLKRWEKIYYQLSLLEPGDCIGEMSLIDLGRRSAAVLAMSDCRLIELTNASLYKLYETDIGQFALIQMNIGRELSRRLRVADETLFLELVKANKIPQH